MVPSISYLGYKIDAQGLHPLPEKMDAILKAPSSTSLTRVEVIPWTMQSLYPTCQQLYTPFMTF